MQKVSAILEQQKVISLIESLPTGPGTYALILKTQGEQNLRVGKLGLLAIRPGYYVYAGSALGPGGLRARLRHHLQGSGPLHWHIDYLRPIAPIIEIGFVSGTERYEHQWAEIFKGSPGVIVPFPGFGSSDCRCRSHLFFWEDRPGLRLLLNSIDIIQQSGPDRLIRIVPVPALHNFRGQITKGNTS